MFGYELNMTAINEQAFIFPDGNGQSGQAFDRVKIIIPDERTKIDENQK